jgi:hypothetical protein
MSGLRIEILLQGNVMNREKITNEFMLERGEG